MYVLGTFFLKFFFRPTPIACELDHPSDISLSLYKYMVQTWHVGSRMESTRVLIPSHEATTSGLIKTKMRIINSNNTTFLIMFLHIHFKWYIWWNQIFYINIPNWWLWSLITFWFIFLNEKCIDLNNNRTIIKLSKKYYRPLDINYLKSNPLKAKKILKWTSKTSLYSIIKIMCDDDLSYMN